MKLTEALGSVNDFAVGRELDPTNPDTLVAYTTALGGLRGAMADLRGIDLDELHALSLRPLEDCIAWDGATAIHYEALKKQIAGSSNSSHYSIGEQASGDIGSQAA